MKIFDICRHYIKLQRSRQQQQIQISNKFSAKQVKTKISGILTSLNKINFPKPKSEHGQKKFQEIRTDQSEQTQSNFELKWLEEGQGEQSRLLKVKFSSTEFVDEI